MFYGSGLFLLSLIAISHCYHNQFDNKQFHIWMIEGANKDNSFHMDNINFVWLNPDPNAPQEDDFVPEPKAIQGKEFRVKYEMQWKDQEEQDNFFEELITKGWLDAVTTVPEAKEFCNRTCGNAGSANKDNCCIHHINIHSCPQAALGSDMCGPWIPDGGVFTHTASLASPIQPWTTNVILTEEGHNFIIAHIRIGAIQMALGHKILVYPKPNCGDGFCAVNSGETCENCKQDCCAGLSTTIIIVIIVISCLLILALTLIPAVWYYQKQKFLYDETWIVDWDNIKPSTGYKGFGSVRSIQSTMLSQTSMGQNGGINPPPVRGQIFCETGIFEGKVVSIKKIAKMQFQLNRSTRIEIRNVRALDHMNLSKFMGIVTDIENFSIITEYCNKGSLNDVLLNDEIPLNWGFRLSFAQDVCRGMEYLHNHKMFHGRLKSSNCIIDDRWVCKITDFGLPDVRRPDDDPELGEQFGSIREKRINRKGSKKGHKSSLKMNRRISGLLSSNKKDVEADNEMSHRDSDSPLPILLSREDKMNRVYRPPEANTDETQIYQPTTDVYSFAIILIEIGGRTEISPPEEAVYDPLWRPDLPDFEDHDKDPDNSLPLANKYIDLIRHCWEEKPSARPTFTEIKKQLHNINPNKENPVDMMMKLMEKYSKHLEAIVAERTHELVEEKKKTDRLLYAMLPKRVAEDLKQGNPIITAKYDACTIFFSDIVGFTNLSSSSTPLEVVELLNQMYTAFDSIIDEHDVYKVETIGDAYMVVSGVPEMNGDRHAEEIATMALKIVCFCRGFRVPHRPNQIVNIRAGIHSGPVVTGVVGLKMPRYCLFGDTVNMASRMESTGEALRIQVSPDTYVILRGRGDLFTFEYRGPIEIKGKGTKETHWLLGKRQPDHQDLLIQNCLSPASHKRIFKGNRLVAPPQPLTSMELNDQGSAPPGPQGTSTAESSTNIVAPTERSQQYRRGAPHLRLSGG
ncbi:atrial natriuretic peptide receptor 1-like isoform X2 [Bolinopsis microptera]|uniref:atrial natriuretic peptide receptor 1-like isoform X2 n=1 Tax=Bolinopsis microptera TaxID=2820187 RepID=UPI003079992B